MPYAALVERISELGVVPVIAIEQAAQGVPLADALLAGGLPVVEITFRTAVAAEVIRNVSRERPHVIVGAGTVLTTANLDAAKAGGAAFAVAPGLNPRIVEHARQIGLPFFPGVATPSEIEQALSLGCRVMKFFPAEALGGTAMIEALSAPYKHAGVRFVPTGGVSPANLESYLKVDTVAAVGGTWIAKNDDLSAGRWDEIRDRCRGAREVVARSRVSQL
jgi:2-dehydro-3-deoxyphosphogluconate aldolase / (4S)-4-hydroxy-2-oxoglutarate aldolase